jgi:hypothetical protein
MKHDLKLKLGDLALLLSSIGSILDMPLPEDEEYNTYGFKKHKHLTDDQSLIVFSDVINYFRGLPVAPGASHAEAVMLMAENNYIYDGYTQQADHPWGKRQLLHLCGVLGWPGSIPRRWDGFTPGQFNRTLKACAKMLTKDWTAETAIAIPEEAEMQKIAQELHRTANLLYFSRRKIRQIGVQEAVGSFRVAVLLHHELGRKVLEKTFSHHPEAAELQAQIDAGPIDWEATGGEIKICADEDMEKPFIEICQKTPPYAQDE